MRFVVRVGVQETTCRDVGTSEQRWRSLELAKRVPRERAMGQWGIQREDVRRKRDRDKCSLSSRQPVAGTSLTDGRMGLECGSENHTALCFLRSLK